MKNPTYLFVIITRIPVIYDAATEGAAVTMVVFQCWLDVLETVNREFHFVCSALLGELCGLPAMIVKWIAIMCLAVAAWLWGHRDEVAVGVLVNTACQWFAP